MKILGCHENFVHFRAFNSCLHITILWQFMKNLSTRSLADFAQLRIVLSRSCLGIRRRSYPSTVDFKPDLGGGVLGGGGLFWRLWGKKG